MSHQPEDGDATVAPGASPPADGAGEAVAWEVVDSTTHWSGYSTVRTDTVVLPDGDTVEREVVEHQPAVAVAAVTADRDVVLVRQYRHALGRYVLEVPAGGVDPDDDDPTSAAQRELREEIGRRAGRLTHLTRFHNSVGWTTEYTDLYLGTDLVDAPPPDGFAAEAEEADMEVVVLPLDTAVDATHDGTITDSKTIIALLLARQHLA